MKQRKSTKQIIDQLKQLVALYDAESKKQFVRHTITIDDLREWAGRKCGESMLLKIVAQIIERDYDTNRRAKLVYDNDGPIQVELWLTRDPESFIANPPMPDNQNVQYTASVFVTNEPTISDTGLKYYLYTAHWANSLEK